MVKYRVRETTPWTGVNITAKLILYKTTRTHCQHSFSRFLIMTDYLQQLRNFIGLKVDSLTWANALLKLKSSLAEES